MSKKAMVVLPTYNERDNLKQLVTDIISLGSPLELVIVDDNSPDGTGKIADNLSLHYPQVKVIHRQGKRGRGLAGTEGFRFAIENEADYILEMDADYSHHPKYLPEFLENMKGYDCVIGSRYIRGGSEKGRSLTRRLVSRLANIYLAMVMGSRIKDLSSGYRCFRREALATINWENIKSEGPAIVQEILYHLLANGIRVKEIPIVFEERRKGKSKLRFRLLFQGLIFPLKSRLTSKKTTTEGTEKML